jgi:hypothetical protein
VDNRRYYREDGWNSTVLPYSQIWATWQYAFPKWRHWNIAYTKQGRRRLVLARAMKALLAAAIIFELVRLRQRSLSSLKDIKSTFRSSLTGILTVAQNSLQSLKEVING